MQCDNQIKKEVERHREFPYRHNSDGLDAFASGKIQFRHSQKESQDPSRVLHEGRSEKDSLTISLFNMVLDL